MNNNCKLPWIASCILAILLGCSKSDFLNVKPRKSILIPNSLEHFQAILDDDLTMNGAATQGLTPQLGESGSDNFYVPDINYTSNLRPQMQNYYVWSSNPYDGLAVLDWNMPYKAVLYANTVLGSIAEIERNEGNSLAYDNLTGQALFHRAHMFHQLAQVFAPAYDPDTDNSGMGIVLRLESDINESLARATVRETYDRIIRDLSISISLLGDNPEHKSRPSRQAAYGLMARVFLTMRDYGRARQYADSCLQIQNELFDFNLASSVAASPFQGTRFSHPVNQEVIYYTAMLSDVGQNYPISANFALVDSNLYAAYHVDDLRRRVFFVQRPEGNRFKGSYSFRNFAHYFSGLSVSEILLIRAECNARAGNVEEALDDLNRLLRARWDKDARYEPYIGLDSDEALFVILSERRKELLYRGLRWSDLRRLNQEGHNISIFRNINGKVYTLPPNDSRWTWPLPPNANLR